MSALSKHEAIYDRDYVESLENQVAMQHQLTEKLEETKLNILVFLDDPTMPLDHLESALTLIESVADSLREE